MPVYVTSRLRIMPPSRALPAVRKVLATYRATFPASTFGTSTYSSRGSLLVSGAGTRSVSSTGSSSPIGAFACRSTADGKSISAVYS